MVKTSLGGVGRKRIVSSSSSSSVGTNSGSVTGSARLSVVLGSLYLLSGRLGDAVASIHNALPVFTKSMTDPIWLAGGLEVLGCALLLLELKSKGSSLNPSSSMGTLNGGGSADEYAGILGNLTQASKTYHAYRTPFPSTTGARNPLPGLYTWCTLRQARTLHLLSRTRGELGPDALSSFLADGASGSVEEGGRFGGSSVSRSDVASQTSLAHGPWLLGLDPRERIEVLGVMTRLMKSIGFRRKEGLYARELVNCLADAILNARNQSVGGPKDKGASGGVAVRGVLDSVGNDGLVRLMESVLQGYGVDLERPVFGNGLERMVVGGKEHIAEDALEKERFGWEELMVRALRDGIFLGEVLPGKFCVLLAFSFPSFLVSDGGTLFV